MTDDGPSVKDILEKFDVADRSEEAVEMVHAAKEAGISKKSATPAIVVHIIHKETDKTWPEICNELEIDLKNMLQYRRELVKSDVISDKVQRPSELAKGRVRNFLELTENAHADEIYDGTSPSNWVAAATYLDEWVHLRGTTLEMVADQYQCSTDTIVELSSRLVNFSTFARAYAENGDIDGSLGALLRRRRHTKESLRLTLSETTNAVSDRLAALDRESSYQLQTTEYAGVKFYWTEEEG